MFRRKRGITLVTLTINIIVLIILASVTTYTGVNTIKNARYYNVVAELKEMKTKVDKLYEEYQSETYYALCQTKLKQGGTFGNGTIGTKLFDANGQLIPSVEGYSHEYRAWLYYDSDITIYAH